MQHYAKIGLMVVGAVAIVYYLYTKFMPKGPDFAGTPKAKSTEA